MIVVETKKASQPTIADGPGHRSRTRVALAEARRNFFLEAGSSSGSGSSLSVGGVGSRDRYYLGGGSMRRRRPNRDSSADPGPRRSSLDNYNPRHRSSSFCHGSTSGSGASRRLDGCNSTQVEALLSGGSRMVTTFSAEGGDSETSLTTIADHQEDARAKSNSVLLLELTRLAGKDGSMVPAFDLRAETDSLINRTEELNDGSGGGAARRGRCRTRYGEIAI